MLSRTVFSRRASAALVRHASNAAAADINSSKLQVHRTTNPKPKVPKEKLSFGTTFTDHMLEVDWEQDKGWGNPVIRPYGPIPMDPASSALHYALQCFEGMKAYVDNEGKIRLFRPEMNMARLNASMNRLLLPGFDGDQLIECLKKLLCLDRDWIPQGDGYSLYIRPTGISTHSHIGITASTKAKIFIILSPVGPYYREGFDSIKLVASSEFVRAWPGGTGNYKFGANYAPCVMPLKDAVDHGYAQNLWMFGPDHDITEVGTTNLFVHWINENGESELVTPPLTRGDILPGVTRDSILHLARQWGEFKVSEKNVTMKQVKKAAQEGRLEEIFGAGTAAVISPVSTINYMGEDLHVPLKGSTGKSGPLAERIWKAITDIQYGHKGNHPWSVVVD